MLNVSISKQAEKCADSENDHPALHPETSFFNSTRLAPALTIHAISLREGLFRSILMK